MAESKDILKELVRNESRKSYEAFFVHYYQDLFLWANSILKNPAAAEDVVQEFFACFYEKKTYKLVTSNLQSYIYRAVKNSCLNYLNRQKKMIYNIEHLKKEESDYQGKEPNLDHLQKIHSAINELPEKCKQIFMHCCVSGYTYTETAEELGISINTVRTQMFRAFKQLRSKLKSPHLFYLLLLLKPKATFSVH